MQLEVQRRFRQPDLLQRWSHPVRVETHNVQTLFAAQPSYPDIRRRSKPPRSAKRLPTVVSVAAMLYFEHSCCPFCGVRDALVKWLNMMLCRHSDGFSSVEAIDVFAAHTFDLHAAAAFCQQPATVFAAKFAVVLHLHPLQFWIECPGL